MGATLRAPPFRRWGKSLFSPHADPGRRWRFFFLRKRTIAAGDGWSVGEFVCDAGPGDRPFEERHQGFTIAATLAGSFTYRGESGEATLFPGALLLGNSGKRYACGHAHSRGDRCVSLNLSPEAFAEIAASATDRAATVSPLSPRRPTAP